MNEPQSIEKEKPVKRAVSSGTSFECHKCSEKDPMFVIPSMAQARKHFENTGHAVFVSAWFNSVSGTEEQYEEATYDPRDI